MKLANLTAYANGIGANEEILSWINVVVGASLIKKRNISLGDIEHVIDYLMSPQAPRRLQKMSITQAKIAADAWSKANQKKGRNLIDGSEDIETIHQYADGSRIVKLLSEKAYKREGFMMSHCLGGYSVKSDIDIYSYRDVKNNPHATFEVRKSGGEITQIKGKGNGEIHPKYIHPILDFLTSIGQKPRPSEMKNLGYYHIDQAHIDFVKNIVGVDKFLITIHGETYAHS